MADSRRHRRPNRQLARRILVVTEGTETEPQYVEKLASFLRSRESNTNVKRVGVGKDPLKVVKKCIELRDSAATSEKAYDACACLVDVDEHASLVDACRLARKEQILLLVSNLKFETWLRWHAEDRRSALSSAQLDRRVASLGLVRGKSLRPSFPIEKADEAARVARDADPQLGPCRRGPNPSTAMPVLIDLIRGTATD